MQLEVSVLLCWTQGGEEISEGQTDQSIRPGGEYVPHGV